MALQLKDPGLPLDEAEKAEALDAMQEYLDAVAGGRSERNPNVEVRSPAAGDASAMRASGPGAAADSDAGDGRPARQELLASLRQVGGAGFEEDLRRRARQRPPQVALEPGFVLKTRLSSGEKLFANICGATEVPLPEGDWSHGAPPDVEAAMAALEHGEGTAAEGVQIPIACGDLDRSTDKSESISAREADHASAIWCQPAVHDGWRSHDRATIVAWAGGQPCVVVDVVINSGVLSHTLRDARLKLFLIDVALSFLARHHQLTFDGAYSLPNLKYKGEPKKVGARARPLVAEFADPKAKKLETLQVSPQRAKRQERGLGGRRVEDSKGEAAMSSVVPETQARQPLATSPAVHEATGQLEKGQLGKGQQGPASAAASVGAPLQSLKHVVEYVGRPVEQIVIRMALPHSKGLQDVIITIVGTFLLVDVEGYSRLEVGLLFHIDVARARAMLDDGEGGIVLILPIKPYADAVKDMSKMETL
eukprot:SM000097S24779  [mRNA]  locus=s97:192751:195605:+ [translate_table: standard]